MRTVLIWNAVFRRQRCSVEYATLISAEILPIVAPHIMVDSCRIFSSHSGTDKNAEHTI